MLAVPVDCTRDPRIVRARPAQPVANACPRVAMAHRGFVRLQFRPCPCRITFGHADTGRINRYRWTALDRREVVVPAPGSLVNRGLTPRVAPRRPGYGDPGVRATAGVGHLRRCGAPRQHGRK